MAGEEDVELRDLVAHTLETKGVLGKIRAQLRANVFLALEEQESQQKPHPLVSSKFQQYLKTKDGQVATALVREFLTFFELDYTRSVFDPETNALETCSGRHQLARDLGLDVSTASGPLLDSVLQRATQPPAPSHIPEKQPPISEKQPPISEKQPPLSTTSVLLTCAQVTHTTATTTLMQPIASGSSLPTTSSTATTSMDDASALFSNSASKTALKPRAGDDACADFPESHQLHHSTHPENQSLTAESLPPLHHTPLQFSAEAKQEGQQVTNLMAGRSTSEKDVGGGHVNGRSNDIFDKKLPSHMDDMNRRRMDLGQDPSNQDDFHSDVSFSERSDIRALASKLDETEDLTMSQNSLADFDYAEPANT